MIILFEKRLTCACCGNKNMETVSLTDNKEFILGIKDPEIKFPISGNLVIELFGCRICGFLAMRTDAILSNYCASENCSLNAEAPTPIDDDARFCPVCGSPSTFKRDDHFEE